MIRFGTRRWLALSVALILAVLMVARASANVSVTSFTAQAQTNQIVLNWKTASETSNAGFNLYRATSPNGPWNSKLNSNLIPACPGCALGASYSFNDATAPKGPIVYYRLESVDFNSSTQSFGPASAQISVPATVTPTSAAPTATRTSTSAGTATPTSIPGTATATVYYSPTPLGTPPTSTPFPTRVAFVVGQPTLTSALSSSVRAAPQNSNAPDAAPGANASPPVSENPSPNVRDDSTATDLPGETEISNAPSPRPTSNILVLGLIVVASLFGLGSLSFGAVAVYFFSRRFIH